METVVANICGKVRRVKSDGRTFLVAPTVMLAPRVLNGSAGPLFYPASEIARSAEAWDGKPITVGHPKVNGEYVSASDPGVLERIGIGHVRGVSVDESGRLLGEAWIDEERARAVDPRVLAALNAGKPVEVSTGLFTENKPAPKGATFDGDGYDFIATNYRPDHLAVLLDEEGACSVRDGCGLNVNAGAGVVKRFLDWLTGATKSKQTSGSGGDSEGETVTTATANTAAFDRRKALAFLANCGCGKAPADRAALEKLSDDALRTLQANAEQSAKLVLIVNRLKRKPTRNADGEGGDGEGEVGGVDIAALAEFLGITEDPAADPVAFIEALKAKLDEVVAKLGGTAPAAEPAPAEEEVGNIVYGEDCEGDDNDDPECRAMFAKIGNRRKAAARNRRPAANSRLTPEEQEDLAWARRMKTQEKQALVGRLTANVSDPRQRQRKAAMLQAKPLGELRELAELLPPPPEQDYARPVVNYFGAAGGPAFVGNAGGGFDPGEDTDMAPPRIDYAELASRRRA